MSITSTLDGQCTIKDDILQKKNVSLVPKPVWKSSDQLFPVIICIGNGIILMHQCRCCHIDCIFQHHGGHIVTCLIFICHGLHGCQSPTICFYSNSIPSGRSLASRSSLVHNFCLYSKDWSTSKIKHRMIKQVWCFKKDWNVVKK
jgi:hypothetical protein